LVGTSHWLPPEPFEFGWAPGVGCNNLRCDRCGEPVFSRVRTEEERRRYDCTCRRQGLSSSHFAGCGAEGRLYACACQRDEVVGVYEIGSDEDDDLYLPRLSGWVCAGHPDFLLPAGLDGVRLDSNTDWDALAVQGLLHPPFVPPGIELSATWITRTYRFLGIERSLLSRAVAGLLTAEDPRLVEGAFDFFYNEPEAAGAESLAGSVVARRQWLATTPWREWPTAPLIDYASLLVHERLRVVDEGGGPTDRPAMETAKHLASDGIGPYHTPLAFFRHDPDWLLTHAVALMRANPRWIGMLVHLVPKADDPEQWGRVLREIADITPDHVRARLAAVLRSSPGNQEPVE
jgi:hypothetical protein